MDRLELDPQPLPTQGSAPVEATAPAGGPDDEAKRPEHQHDRSRPDEEEAHRDTGGGAEGGGAELADAVLLGAQVAVAGLPEHQAQALVGTGVEQAAQPARQRQHRGPEEPAERAARQPGLLPGEIGDVGAAPQPGAGDQRVGADPGGEPWRRPDDETGG